MSPDVCVILGYNLKILRFTGGGSSIAAESHSKLCQATISDFILFWKKPT